jgi:hypothetical protein
MLNFKLATVLTLDELRRLMTSVRMLVLVYSMESLLCLTIFKIIMLMIDNKMYCVRIVVFRCFIIFYVCVCYFTYCLLFLCCFVDILLKTNLDNYFFIYFREVCLDFTEWGPLTKHSLFIIPPNVSNNSARVKYWCFVH